MRRAIPGGSSLVFLLLLGTPPSDIKAAGDPDWPPLPPAQARHALNQDESEAGVVLLEASTEVSGTMRQTALKMKGSATRSARYRILVLDARGAEKVVRHAFFGERSEDVTDIQGRTVTPDGKEYPLDADKDIKTLDLKDTIGKRQVPIRIVLFPHVEPGAVLDLAYTLTSGDLPDYEQVDLQTAFPVRQSKVKVHGLIFENSVRKAYTLGLQRVKVYWVPFLLGRVPPRAHATLDAEFNLDLIVSDVPADEEQPYAPPRERTRYTLGLLPRLISLDESEAIEDWRRNLLLFGPPPARWPGAKQTFSRDLDTGRGMIQLDDLGLQLPPPWESDHALMRWYQDVLHHDHDRLEKFFRKPGEGESEQAVAEIAPPYLPWRERARLLFDYVRSRVKPDPEAEEQKTLARLIKYGRSSGGDLSLYLTYLLEKSHIPARIVVPINRFRLPFQPIVESFRLFGTSYVVETGPEGEVPLYLIPGDVFATFGYFPDSYLGALAFRQPKGKDDDWPLVQIPRSLPPCEKTEVAFSAPLDVHREETELTLKSTLHDSAATYFRWRLGWERSKENKEALETRRRKVIEDWVDRWTNLAFKGTVPDLDPRTEIDRPFVFELRVPWNPDTQDLGAQVLVPALPHADLLVNVFKSERRSVPIWLAGGQYEISMTWSLPAGASVEQIPASAVVKGPGGLAFAMESSFRPSGAGRENAYLKTTVRVEEPYMLPASEYAGVKKFYEDLQRMADTRLLVLTGSSQ